MNERERRALCAITLAVGMALALAPAVPADAAIVICQKKNRIKLRVDVCKNKETLVEPSELGISAGGGPYGDGSAGALVVDDFQTLDDLVPDGNLQFTSITITAGGTLSVPSGTVLRCSESFVNDGQVIVETSARPGSLTVLSPTSQVVPRHSFPDPTVAQAARGPGATVDSTGWEAASSTGLFDRARFILHPGRHGGAAGSRGPRGGGGSGGGSLTVLAGQSLTNNGTIQADADDGGTTGAGGGGGGFVILASAAQILHAATGSISVRGGAGGFAGDTAAAGALPASTSGPGGGGGGGCVHLLAPLVTNAGPVELGGGTAGPIQTVTLRQLRSGGAGGGASCGNGGGGGRITVTTPGDADPGTDGALIVTLADPTSMF